MKLDDVCGTFVGLEFPPLGIDAHPDLESVVRARSSVSAAVAHDEFLAECIAHELDVVERSRRRPGLLPFFEIGGLGIRFSFGYWPPGSVPGAHEHTAWTITAVCRNELEIITFDRPESYRRRMLVQKRKFRAEVGQVGYIYEPAIHAPQNRSRDWTLSFHVTSPRDGERIGCVEPLLPPLTNSVVKTPNGHPYVAVLKSRERQAKLRLLARTLLSLRAPASTRALAQCHRLASSMTRELIRRERPEDFAAERGARWLRRSHEQLQLELRREGDGWAVRTMTPRGMMKVLAINEAAREAFAFAIVQEHFEVRMLPGGLSVDERDAVGDTLEETGMFERVET